MANTQWEWATIHDTEAIYMHIRGVRSHPWSLAPLGKKWVIFNDPQGGHQPTRHRIIRKFDTLEEAKVYYTVKVATE